MTLAASPGKLILGGEHAVVHGAPALALAVDRQARAEALPVSEPLITLRLADRPRATLPLDGLSNHLMEIRNRHREFQAGKRPIREVCPEPEDLLLAAAALAEPERGVDILVESDIPLGAGLGSSAACLLALLKALRPEWDADTLFRKALEAEHFQHGGSSGLDVAASLHGGLIWMEKGRPSPLADIHPPPFRVFDTGRPDSTTGECVAAVRQQFPSGHSIWREFAQVVRDMRAALGDGDSKAWTETVRRNHRLLQTVGVVPDAVSRTIETVEAAGGAAKLCGAGSIRGASAGMLLVIGGENVGFPSDWTRLELRPSTQGTRLL